jgi:hypothetical protein
MPEIVTATPAADPLAPLTAALGGNRPAAQVIAANRDFFARLAREGRDADRQRLARRIALAEKALDALSPVVDACANEPLYPERGRLTAQASMAEEWLRTLVEGDRATIAAHDRLDAEQEGHSR